MKIKDWLNKVSYIAESDIPGDKGMVYLSRFDGSYITRLGMEENISLLAEREITEELTHGVGFSPKNNKWYGWSHRAISGFSVGSTCKIGDCHYIASTLEDQEKDAIRFWQSDHCVNVKSKGISKNGKDKYFIIEWMYDNEVHNKKLRNTIGNTLHYITPLGRGEWIATTLEDAKQMAIDFNEGVS